MFCEGMAAGGGAAWTGCAAGGGVRSSVPHASASPPPPPPLPRSSASITANRPTMSAITESVGEALFTTSPVAVAMSFESESTTSNTCSELAPPTLTCKIYCPALRLSGMSTGREPEAEATTPVRPVSGEPSTIVV